MNEQDKFKKRQRPISQKEAFIEHGKLPPQAVDIEEIVLGALMLEKNAISTVVNLLSSDVFYKEAHQVIYRAIISLYDKSQPVDILTVTNRLKETNNLELSGGPFYITQLTSRIASSANIEHHAGILVQKFLQREIIRVSTELIRDSFDDTIDPFDLLAKSDNEFSKISEFTARGGSLSHISSSVKKSVESAHKRQLMFENNQESGITTGLYDLNKLTGGWQPSDLIIIAARPGMGKTSVMLKFASSAARSGKAVCIYSLEMSDERLADNMILSLCNVDKDKFKKGDLSRYDWQEISYAKDMLDKMPVYIDPNPVVSMRYIKANSRVMAKKGQCDMIMIDYLQLADIGSDDRNRNREQDVAQASRNAKIIAKELNVPVILLSQLSRKVEERHNKIPQLSDLRESGAIEQDADIVAFLYRPEYYGIDNIDGQPTKGIGQVIVAKHRNGSTDDVNFRYNPSMTRIEDFYTKESTVQQTIQPNIDFENGKTPF